MCGDDEAGFRPSSRPTLRVLAATTKPATAESATTESFTTSSAKPTAESAESAEAIWRKLGRKKEACAARRVGVRVQSTAKHAKPASTKPAASVKPAASEPTTKPKSATTSN